MKAPVRILIAKVGLDGHDRGARFIAQALRDHGYEVIYTGIRRTPEEVAEIALAEDVQLVGLSSLSGGHAELFPRVAELLAASGASDIVLFAGGVIPVADVAALKEAGVRRVFGPGSTVAEIADFIESCMVR